MEVSTAEKPLGQGLSPALPNLIVIGAQKCGTSVLHYYLSLHPEVSMSKPKELNFFIEERNWPRGLDWYKAHFDGEATVRGEASPNYTAFPQHEGVPERMASVVPDAKLIYMVRDPLERIAAHWVHNYAKRREKGTLAETLVHPNTSYVTRSLYAMQLERFLAHYPKEQILVFQQSELRHKRMETLRQIFEFIGVDPDFNHPRFEQERHQTSGKTRATRLAVKLEKLGRSRRGRFIPSNFWLVLDDRLPLRKAIKRPDVKASLPPETLDELRADAVRLRELTGRDFSNWKIWD
jgi:hypothetical protein